MSLSFGLILFVAGVVSLAKSFWVTDVYYIIQVAGIIVSSVFMGIGATMIEDGLITILRKTMR